MCFYLTYGNHVNIRANKTLLSADWSRRDRWWSDQIWPLCDLHISINAERSETSRASVWRLNDVWNINTTECDESCWTLTELIQFIEFDLMSFIDFCRYSLFIVNLMCFTPCWSKAGAFFYLYFRNFISLQSFF